MAQLKWKYTPDEILYLKKNSISERYNNLLYDWSRMYHYGEGVTQDEVDEIEELITHLM